jgi:hypothetical protein
MDVQNNVTVQIAAALEWAIQEGFELPFYLVAVAVNGSMLYGRYYPATDRGGLECEVLSKLFVDEFFQVPVNMMLVDSTGQAARVLLTKDEELAFTTLQ